MPTAGKVLELHKQMQTAQLRADRCEMVMRPSTTPAGNRIRMV